MSQKKLHSRRPTWLYSAQKIDFFLVFVLKLKFMVLVGRANFARFC